MTQADLIQVFDCTVGNARKMKNICNGKKIYKYIYLILVEVAFIPKRKKGKKEEDQYGIKRC